MIENIASDHPTATRLTLNRYSRTDIAQLIAPLRLKSCDTLFVTVTEQGESSLRYLPIYIKSNGFVDVCSDHLISDEWKDKTIGISYQYFKQAMREGWAVYLAYCSKPSVWHDFDAVPWQYEADRVIISADTCDWKLNH
jgi:hypothetical protein